MKSQYYPARPGILTAMGYVSLIWSGLSLAGVVVACSLFGLLGLGSWLGGPVVGAVGSAVGMVAILCLLCGSILSFLLFAAGWRTLRDDPSGITLHRTWAWVSIALDLFALAATTGFWATSWLSLAYAIWVLYATNLPEVRAYAREDGPVAILGKPARWDDEAF